MYSSVQGLHKYVGRDAAAYNLNYYHTATEEDYMAVKYNDYNGTTNKNPLADKGNLYSGSAAGFVLDTHGPSLFNGNISSMATTLVNKNSSVSTVGLNDAFVQLSGYRYDQLNRLKQMKTYRTMSYGSNAWTLPTSGNSDDAYLNQFSYDANGNILTQKRNGPTTALLSGGVKDLDDLSYTYNSYGVHHSNQLYCVSDAVSASNYNDDLDDQSSSCVTDPLSGAYTSSNYGYNKIGSLAKDKQECIDTIIWTVDRKVRYIIRNATLLSAAGRTLDDIEYQYDANRRRVCKIVKPRDGTTKALKDQDSWVYTYYVYDGGGNVMATYERNYTLSSGTYTDHYALKELDLYGSNRLGLVHTDADGDITNRTFTASMSSGLFTGISYGTAPSPYSYANPLPTKRWLGRKELEMTNHLGNVITTTSDRKLQDEYGADAGSNSTVDYYTADILSESDYYPFGAPMAGRSTPGSTYRYGFNGQEHENEVVTGNHSAEYWMYDARLGRRWNVDPVTHEYESPYATFDNNPIFYADPDGADPGEPDKDAGNKGGKKQAPNGGNGGTRQWNPVRDFGDDGTTKSVNGTTTAKRDNTNVNVPRYNSLGGKAEPLSFGQQFEKWEQMIPREGGNGSRSTNMSGYQPTSGNPHKPGAFKTKSNGVEETDDNLPGAMMLSGEVGSFLEAKGLIQKVAVLIQIGDNFESGITAGNMDGSSNNKNSPALQNGNDKKVIDTVYEKVILPNGQWYWKYKVTENGDSIKGASYSWGPSKKKKNK